MRAAWDAEPRNELLALLRLAPASIYRAAYITTCNAQDAADATVLLEALGLTWQQARRGQRIAQGHA